MTIPSNLTDFQGKPCSIVEQLALYENGQLKETEEWLWNHLYHQGDIGTASIAWILEAHSIFINAKVIDWNYLAFCAAVMASIEKLKFIACPAWAEGKYRECAKTALAHALKSGEDVPKTESLTLISISCAISGAYDSYNLVEYAWGGYEERLMELDFEQYP